MPVYKPFDYSQVMGNVENIRGARTRNALAQQQLDPQSVGNQLRQEQLTGARQGNVLAQQRGTREQTTFDQQQGPALAKEKHRIFTEISQNPSAAGQYSDQLMSWGVDISTQSPDEIQMGATKAAQALGESLRIGQRGKGPSAVQEYNFYQDLSPANKATFLQIKRAQPNAKFVDTGPTVEVRDPITGQKVTEIDKGLTPQQEPEAIREAETVKADVKRKADIAKKLPKARSAMKGTKAKISLMKSKTQEARGLVGPFTTGAGSLLANIPGTEAKRLQGVIETIKANLGFGELAEMRATSPTGGAVGQLSDKELKVLSAVKQALDQAQSSSDVIDALDMLDERLTGMEDRVVDAFNQDFMGKESAPAEDLSIDDLVSKYAQ
jgi:hypothetical protein